MNNFCLRKVDIPILVFTKNLLCMFARFVVNMVYSIEDLQFLSDYYEAITHLRPMFKLYFG